MSVNIELDKLIVSINAFSCLFVDCIVLQGELELGLTLSYLRYFFLCHPSTKFLARLVFKSFGLLSVL